MATISSVQSNTELSRALVSMGESQCLTRGNRKAIEEATGKLSVVEQSAIRKALNLVRGDPKEMAKLESFLMSGEKARNNEVYRRGAMYWALAILGVGAAIALAPLLGAVGGGAAGIGAGLGVCQAMKSTTDVEHQYGVQD